MGYIVGLWAPGKRLRFRLAGRVLLNLLDAHCAADRALKAMPGGAEALVGLVHQHIRFEAASVLPHVRCVGAALLGRAPRPPRGAGGCVRTRCNRAHGHVQLLHLLLADKS